MLNTTGGLDCICRRGKVARAASSADLCRSGGTTTYRSVIQCAMKICRGDEEACLLKTVACLHLAWFCPTFHLLPCRSNLFPGGIPKEFGKLKALRKLVIVSNDQLGGEVLGVTTSFHIGCY